MCELLLRQKLRQRFSDSPYLVQDKPSVQNPKCKTFYVNRSSCPCEQLIVFIYLFFIWATFPFFKYIYRHMLYGMAIIFYKSNQIKTHWFYLVVDFLQNPHKIRFYQSILSLTIFQMLLEVLLLLLFKKSFFEATNFIFPT